MDNQILADDLELFALQEAAVLLGANHLLVIAAAAIRAQYDGQNIPVRSGYGKLDLTMLGPLPVVLPI
jgi:hypothetical protein